jgi:hypothetical protein
VALLVLVGHVPAAHAHYREPPSDWNAAPAVVQVETAFHFAVSIAESELRVRSYRVEVPGPRGTGAIFDPSGAVITTRETVLPDPKRARIEGVNRGFDAARPPGWTTPDDMSKRHTVAERRTNQQLQACYAADSGCITFLGNTRTVVLNTTRPTRLAGVGFKEIANGLAILPTNDARSDTTPTVGIAAEIPADSPFIALGYNDKRQLTRFAGRLADGKLSDGDSTRIQKTFVSDGAGTMLVGPGGKGSILGVVRPVEGGVRLVAPQAGINAAGYRPIRGSLHQRIDNALGFFNGEHYSHSVPLLTSVTQTLPDVELLKKLEVARAKAGTGADKSYTDPMNSATTTTDQGWLRWAWIGLAALGVAAAVVLLLLLRRRANGRAETLDDDDDDDDLDSYDDDATYLPPAQRVPDHRDFGAVGGSGSAATQPVGRTDPGVAVAEIDRPAEDQSAVRYCTSCGAALAAGDRFCYSCGAAAR